MQEDTAVKVARLDEKVYGVATQLTKQDAKLDTLIAKVDSINVVQGRIDDLDKKVTALERQRIWNNILYPAAALVVGYLAMNALGLLKGGR